MRRRTLLGTALALANASPLLAALRGGRWDDAAEVLERAAASNRVESAELHVAHRDESFTHFFGKAGSSRRPVHVPASAGAGRHQLAGRVGDPLRRHPAQGLGRQPDLGRCAGAVGADVGVADVLAAGAFGPGLPQSTPARHAGGAGLAPVNYRAFSLASPAGRGRIPAADSESPEVRARHGPSRQRPSHAPPGRAWSTYPGRVGLTRWSG